ncbi:hypothetical protein HJFPF1_03344 [Paramyrothecium foliicola]|nr:hypothetical protein HJFPF1_03344 [Paramyrothecium foliicola]
MALGARLNLSLGDPQGRINLKHHLVPSKIPAAQSGSVDREELFSDVRRGTEGLGKGEMGKEAENR